MKLYSMIPNTEGCSTDEKVRRLEDYLHRMAEELDYILENLDETNFTQQGLSAVRGE